MKKVDAERLLTGYDADPIGALTAALRIVLDMPEAEWARLVPAAPIGAARQRLLLDGDQLSLDQLAAELNECRRFGGRGPD